MTSAVRLSVLHRRLLPGRSGGLPQATAEVLIGLAGTVGEQTLERIRAGVASLRPGRLLLGVGPADWPGTFVIPGSVRPTDPHWRLGEWIVALAVALQRWAGDPAWRGSVRSVDRSRLEVAIPWHRDRVLDDTLRLAVDLITLWDGVPAGRGPDVNEPIERGMAVLRAEGYPTDPLRLALAGLDRGTPVEARPGHVQYGWGAAMQRLQSTISGQTSHVAMTIAKNKAQTMRILREAGLPVPDGAVVADLAEAVRAATALGWPVVVKPLDQEQGRGVVAGIRDITGLGHAVNAARAYSPAGVLVEKHVHGADYRLQVVNGRCIATHLRIPGGVTGDGVSTVEGLLRRLNADPRRGTDPRSFMKKLKLNAEALECLADQDVRIDSVPAAGRWIALRRIANVSAGGSAEDVTETVDPDNLRLAERASRIVGLDIAGVDLLTPDITRSWREVGGAICEVNSYPQLGDPVRDTYGEILDLLFGGRSGRIPVAAVIGSGASHAVAELTHRIWTAAGRCAGLATSTVVQVGAEILSTEAGDGALRASAVLNDPAVEAAVLELSAEEIAADGQPCDRYDVVALVEPDLDPDTGAREARRDYSAVLRNACTVVVGLAGQQDLGRLPLNAGGLIIVTSRNPLAANVLDHLDREGRAVVVGERDGCDWLVLAAGVERTHVLAVDALANPGRVDEALFAAGLAWAQGVGADAIRSALMTAGARR